MNERYIVKYRQYHCHPETCGHEEHFVYGIWDSRCGGFVNDGADTFDECRHIADYFNKCCFDDGEG